MITLYGFGPGFGLPEISPYVTKTEVQLKMAGLDYRKQRTMPADAPKGQLPWIEDGGERIGDSTFIRAHLERRHGVDFDEGLTSRQRAAAWALERIRTLLGGWAYGPELGTAPVTIIVGGITASPFPFGDGRGPAGGGAAAWWPALAGDDLIDPARSTVLCPCWPGNGSSWRGFDGPDPPPAISVLGLADLVAAWLDGCGCFTRLM